VSLYEEMKERFSPRLREKLRRQAAAVDENERRARTNALAVEVGALAADPTIQAHRVRCLAYGATLAPGPSMDAAACYWMRRGFEESVRLLDEAIGIPQSEEQNNG
jgi:hypothetical protein